MNPSRPSSGRAHRPGFFALTGAFLAVWFKLVLALIGAFLMLFVVLAGLLVGAVMLVWGLLTGRKPQMVWFRRGPGGHADGLGRQGRFGETFRDPFSAFTRRRAAPRAKGSTDDVVDVQVREVPDPPPRELPPRG